MRSTARPDTDAPSMPSGVSATQVRSVTSETVVIAPDDSDCLDDDEARDGALTLGWPMSAASSAQAQPSQQQASVSQSFACPQPTGPLIEVAPRLYFAVFHEPMPHPDTLNAGTGTAAAAFPPEPPMSAGDHIIHYWSAIHPDGLDPRPGVVQGWAPTQPLPQKFHWITTELPYMVGDRAIPYEYLPFYDDWGPLNMSMLFLFCDHMASLMRDPVLKDHGIVLYSSSDPIRKTNTAALAALRNILVLGQSPADAFYPFATMDFQPWRDAGYGRADFCLTLQDVLYGAWRAQQNGLFDLARFDLDEYFYSEQPANGDWNWISPNFIAFASPNDPVYVKRLLEGRTMLTADDERKSKEWDRRKSRLINDFARRKVQLVVRLNNALYDKAIFQQAGIDHVDMYFDDGSNPTPEILRDFIDRADKVVEQGGVVAVHCKAGLGRTGVLIGAYLVWKYGFKASEAIGWMRVQRPGCVVGPQQQFLYEQSDEWVKWGEQARASKLAESQLALERAEMAKTIAQLKAQLEESRAQTQSAVAKNKTKKRKSSDLPSGEENDPSLVRPNKAQSLQAVGPSDVFASAHAHTNPISMNQTPAPPRPHTPVDTASTVARIKPTPCVGQPRKSPSPAHKRYVHHLSAGLSPRRDSAGGSSSGSSGSNLGLGSAGLGEPLPRSRTPSNPFAQAQATSAAGAVANLSPERRAKPALMLGGGNSSSDESDSGPGTGFGDDVTNTPTRVNYSPSSVLSRSGGRSNDSPVAKLATGFNLASPVRRARTPPRAQVPTGVLGDNKTHNIARAVTPTTASDDVFGPKTPTGTATTPTRAGIARASPTVKALYGLKDTSSRAPPSPPPAALGSGGGAVGAGGVSLRSPVRTRSRTMALNRPPTDAASLFRPTVTTRTARSMAQTVGANGGDAAAPRASRSASRATRPTSSRRTTSRSASNSSTGSTGSVGARTRARHAAAAANAATKDAPTAGYGRGRGPLSNRSARPAHPPSALNI